MKEKKLLRALGIKTKSEEKIKLFLNGMFGKTWYFDNWFEKSIFILSLIALIYSIIRILLRGWW